MSQRRIWISLLGCTTLLWLYIAGTRTSSSIHTLPASSKAMEKTTRNRTLGFAEILVAVLPERTDHKDTLALLSHYSDVDITVIDGASKVDQKAIPDGRGSQMTDGILGCWRAHMNMLKTVVEKKLETALLLEADIDWDIRVKDQLTNISNHLPDSTTEHPYGLSWTFFWLGHCTHTSDPEKLGPVISYPDETVSPLEEQRQWVRTEAKLYGVEENGQRMIHRAYAPACAAAYAVTLEGALRMLYEIGHDHLNEPVDVEYKRATRQGKIPGLAITPPIMGQWRAGTARDSNVQNRTSANPGVGSSGPQVQLSVRRELKRLTYANSTALGWAHL